MFNSPQGTHDCRMESKGHAAAGPVGLIHPLLQVLLRALDVEAALGDDKLGSFRVLLSALAFGLYVRDFRCDPTTSGPQ